MNVSIETTTTHEVQEDISKLSPMLNPKLTYSLVLTIAHLEHQTVCGPQFLSEHHIWQVDWALHSSRGALPNTWDINDNS